MFSFLYCSSFEVLKTSFGIKICCLRGLIVDIVFSLQISKSATGDITLKLADFGLAMEVKAPIFTVCGTPTYVAPEILAETGKIYNVHGWVTNSVEVAPS